MTLDWDGKIRMDPSSPSAMASVLAHAGEFDILTGNDADADRHGIVTPDGGLMNPNHYLAVAIEYLFAHRAELAADAAIGKTLVSSLDDRPGRRVARPTALGGAGRVQVVRARPHRRFGRLRRRRERRRVVPALRRHGVDDRQGRHPALPARVRDPRRHRQVAVRALRFARRAVRRPGLRANGCRGIRCPEGGARQARRRRDLGHRARRRADHGEALAGARQRRGDRRRQGRRRTTPGSRRGRAAPKTCTRSTPSRSRGPSTCKAVQAEAKQIVDAALG